jgi:HEAT repeat protein
VCTLLSVLFAWHHTAVNSSLRATLNIVVCLTLGKLFAQEATPPAPLSHEGVQERTVLQDKPQATPAGGLARVTKQDAWQVLQTACTKEKGISRASAVRALGLIKSNARARRLAEEALVDDNPEIRIAAVDALGEMNARSSVPKLRKALNDSDPTVALAAAHSLELMHNRSAYQVYYEVLAGDRKTHRGLIASQASALKDPKKIAKLGIRQGMSFVPYGSLGWGAVKVIAKDDASPVRAAAARALVDDPDPAATKVLIDAAGDKSWMVRAAVLETLAKRGNPASLDTVQLYVYDEKDVVRYTAAAAVLRLTAIRESNARKGKKGERAKRNPASGEMR